MAHRWEKEALAHGWRAPAEGQALSAPVLWTTAAFAVGLGAAWVWWEQVGRRMVREGAIASLPAPLGPGEQPSRDQNRATEDDQLETLATEVSAAALTDGEAADPTATPAEAVAEPAPKPRTPRKKATPRPATEA